MRKIINGKLFDTDTARQVGSAGGGDGFGAWTETLYRKRNNTFFLYGEGGPSTKYAYYVAANNAYSGGSRIIPLTFEAAQEWVEKHLTSDDYDQIFGAPNESEEPVLIWARVSAALVARVKAAAAADGISTSAYVAGIIRDRFGSDD